MKNEYFKNGDFSIFENIPDDIKLVFIKNAIGIIKKKLGVLLEDDCIVTFEKCNNHKFIHSVEVSIAPEINKNSVSSCFYRENSGNMITGITDYYRLEFSYGYAPYFVKFLVEDCIAISVTWKF